MSQTLPFETAEFCTCQHHADARHEPLSWLEIGHIAMRTIYGWMQRSQQRRHLRELDDHALRDIGLSRADVDEEAAKPFWM